MRIHGQEAYLKCEIEFFFHASILGSSKLDSSFRQKISINILSCNSKMESSQTLSNSMSHLIRISFCFNKVHVRFKFFCSAGPWSALVRDLNFEIVFVGSDLLSSELIVHIYIESYVRVSRILTISLITSKDIIPLNK